MSRVVVREAPFVVESWGSGDSDGDVYRVLENGRQLRWSEVRARLVGSDVFRDVLTTALAEADGEAFYWECTPWRSDADPLFQFAVLPAPALASRPADPDAFSAQFAEADTTVVAFANLGGDAVLVVPTPLGRLDLFGHLASWVRGARTDQIHAVWIELGNQVAQWRRQKRGTLWVSTSGGAVPWLHIRLDSRPKYYQHRPYRHRDRS